MSALTTAAAEAFAAAPALVAVVVETAQVAEGTRLRPGQTWVMSRWERKRSQARATTPLSAVTVHGEREQWGRVAGRAASEDPLLPLRVS